MKYTLKCSDSHLKSELELNKLPASGCGNKLQQNRELADKAPPPPPPHPLLLIICTSPVTYWAFIVSDLIGAYNCQKSDPST